MSAITTTKLTKTDLDRHLAYIEITAPEFAEKIGVHLSTLYRWQRAEEFPRWVPLLLLTMRHNRYLRISREPRMATPSDRLYDALSAP